MIGEQAGAQHVPFGTKASGLETLHKIGKTICLSSNDTLGHEIQTQFDGNPVFEDAVFAVVNVLSEEERERMCDRDDGRSTFLQKMLELKQLADEYCLFDELGEVIATLSGDAASEDDGKEPDEGNEEANEIDEEEGEEDERQMGENVDDSSSDKQLDTHHVFKNAQAATIRLQSGHALLHPFETPARVA